MPDELHQPLGLDRARSDATPRRESGRSRAFPLRTALIALAGGCAIAAGAYVMRYGDPNGGAPRVVARIEPLKPAETAAVASRDPAPTGTIEQGRHERQSGPEVERASGVKVTRTGGGDAPGALIIQLDEPSSGVRLAPAPDKRLVERGPSGPLPRIGSDGAKPLDIYARPVVTSPKIKPGAPRIAILVGGMGLSATTTQAALDKLPADVSFAFAPYGGELAADVSRARDRGHEAFLQAPMEPFDYPQNDPGAHTLTTRTSPEETIADLRWLMSRFTGYVGVTNFLGARFTASEGALAPVMRELAARGLGYVDDGASPQSLATSVAASVGAPAARADLVIDADPKPEAIEAQLLKLETIARQKGLALGVASAIPSSIERIARFARALEGRGVALVPASVALSGAGLAQAENKRR